MSGSLLQLNNLGAQDTNLMVNPSITFWKTIFKRHTIFAMECKEQDFNNTPTWGSRCNVEFQRIGDLIRKVYVKITVSALNNPAATTPTRYHFTDDAAKAMFESIELDMGNVPFDTIYPELSHAWEELTTDRERQLGALTGKYGDESTLVDAANGEQTWYLPVDFFWNRDTGAALPLISTLLTPIKIYFKIRGYKDLIVNADAPGVSYGGSSPTLTMSLYMETVMLGDDERSWFASAANPSSTNDVGLEYLFTQRQLSGPVTIGSAAGKSYKNELHLNHPVKELFFLFRTTANLALNDYFNFSGTEAGPNKEAFDTLQLLLNNNQRFQALPPAYFRVLQPHMHHTRIPEKHIYVYSFALNPEDNQPSGSLNFSKIDKAHVNLTFKGPTGTGLVEGMDVFVFAHNYNTFAIKGGITSLYWAS